MLFCTARAPCHKVKRTERGGRVSTLDAVAYPSLVDTSRHHITTTTSPTHPPTALQPHSRRPVQCAYCRRPVFRHPPVIYRRRLPSRPRPAHRRARRVVLLSLHSFQGRQFAARTPTHAHANAHVAVSPSLSHRLRARTKQSDRHRISPPPVATRSRQAAPFLHSTSYPQPDTQHSLRLLSIEQTAINYTAATTSVHLVAPH